MMTVPLLRAAIENNGGLNAAESRKQINEAITQRYTAPSKTET